MLSGSISRSNLEVAHGTHQQGSLKPHGKTEEKLHITSVLCTYSDTHTHTEPIATPLQAVPGRVIIIYISSLPVKLSNRDGSKVSITSIKPLQNQASFFFQRLIASILWQIMIVGRSACIYLLIHLFLVSAMRSMGGSGQNSRPASMLAWDLFTELL